MTTAAQAARAASPKAAALVSVIWSAPVLAYPAAAAEPANEQRGDPQADQQRTDGTERDRVAGAGHRQSRDGGRHRRSVMARRLVARVKRPARSTPAWSSGRHRRTHRDRRRSRGRPSAGSPAVRVRTHPPSSRKPWFLLAVRSVPARPPSFRRPPPRGRAPRSPSSSSRCRCRTLTGSPPSSPPAAQRDSWSRQPPTLPHQRPSPGRPESIRSRVAGLTGNALPSSPSNPCTVA